MLQHPLIDHGISKTNRPYPPLQTADITAMSVEGSSGAPDIPLGIDGGTSISMADTYYAISRNKSPELYVFANPTNSEPRPALLGTIRLHDTETHAANAMVIANDNKTIFVGVSTSAHLYRTQFTEDNPTYTGGTALTALVPAPVTKIALSKNNKFMVLAHPTGASTVTYASVGDDMSLTSLATVNLTNVVDVDISPDGKYIYVIRSGTSGNLQSYRYNGTNMAIISNLSVSNPTSVRVSNDGGRLLIASATVVSVYTSSDGAMIYRTNVIPTYGSRIAVFSPMSSDYFLSMTPYNIADLYKINTTWISPTLVQDFVALGQSDNNGIAFTRDGSYVAISTLSPRITAVNKVQNPTTETTSILAKSFVDETRFEFSDLATLTSLPSGRLTTGHRISVNRNCTHIIQGANEPLGTNNLAIFSYNKQSGVPTLLSATSIDLAIRDLTCAPVSNRFVAVGAGTTWNVTVRNVDGSVITNYTVPGTATAVDYIETDTTGYVAVTTLTGDCHIINTSNPSSSGIVASASGIGSGDIKMTSDGRRILIVDNMTIKVLKFDAVAGTLTLMTSWLFTNGSGTLRIDVTEDGGYVVVASGKRLVYLALNGYSLSGSFFREHYMNQPSSSIAVSRDGKYIVVGMTTVRFDVYKLTSDGIRLEARSQVNASHGASDVSIVYDRDSALDIVSTYYQVATGNSAHVGRLHRISARDIGVSTKYANITTGAYPAIYTQGELSEYVALETTEECQSMKMSADGKWIIYTSTKAPYIHTINTETMSIGGAIGLSGVPAHIDITPNGRLVVAVTTAGQIYLLTNSNGNLSIVAGRVGTAVLSVRVSDDGKFIFILLANSHLMAYRIMEGNSLSPIGVSANASAYNPLGMQVSKSGKYVLVYGASNGTFARYSFNKTTGNFTFMFTGTMAGSVQVLDAQFSRNDKFVYLCDANARIYIYKATATGFITTASNASGSRASTGVSISVSPDNGHILKGSSDYAFLTIVAIWGQGMGTSQVIMTQLTTAPGVFPRYFLFSPDGRIIYFLEGGIGGRIVKILTRPQLRDRPNSLKYMGKNYIRIDK